MPYVRRDASGEIESVHRAASQAAREYLDADDPSISAFFGLSSPAAAGVDRPIAIIMDAAINALIAKGVLAIEDLSPEAKAAWLLHQELQTRRTTNRFAASGFVEIIDDSMFGSLRG